MGTNPLVQGLGIWITVQFTVAWVLKWSLQFIHCGIGVCNANTVMYFLARLLLFHNLCKSPSGSLLLIRTNPVAMHSTNILTTLERVGGQLGHMFLFPQPTQVTPPLLQWPECVCVCVIVCCNTSTVYNHIPIPMVNYVLVSEHEPFLRLLTKTHCVIHRAKLPMDWPPPPPCIPIT